MGSSGQKKITALVGTLAYISPEQTGRVSRSIDYRTDLYSLGVVLYQLATGCLPFSTDDSLEFLHMIIAKAPLPPHAIKAQLPQPVSAIILKLLSKNADDRYQSAWGVRADLARVLKLCLSQRGVDFGQSTRSLGFTPPIAATSTQQAHDGQDTPLSAHLSPLDESAPVTRSSSVTAVTEPYTHTRSSSDSFAGGDLATNIASSDNVSSLEDEPDPVQQIIDADLVASSPDRSTSAEQQQPQRPANFQYDIPPFVLAAHDIVSRLNIPQKLFGRETETAELLSSVDELFATGRASIVCIRGPAGSGKSSLLSSILDVAQERRTMFASARCEQINRMPYDCLIQAVNELVLRILSKSAAKVKAWKERIMHAVESNAALMTAIFPSVESIVGPQPAVPYLQASESVHRLNSTFVKFLSAFASKRRPLLLLLDDVQWADSASLKMIQQLVCDAACSNTLICLSFRDDQLQPDHRLHTAIANIAASGVPTKSIAMRALGLTQVNALVSETLGCSPERSLPLSSIILTKSDGSPFAVVQLLLSLHAERLLYFAIDSSQPDAKGQWYWSEEAMQSRELTTDVLQLVLKKVQALPKVSQTVLRFAACIGGRFDVEALSSIADLSRAAVMAALVEPIKQELVLQVRESTLLPAIPLSVKGEKKEGQVNGPVAGSSGSGDPRPGRQASKAGADVLEAESPMSADGESELQRSSSSPARPLSLALSSHRIATGAYNERLVYTFLHDRVRDACDSLMEAEERARTHLRIARHLHRQLPQQSDDEAVSAVDVTPTVTSRSSAHSAHLARMSPSSRPPPAAEASAKRDEVLFNVVHHYNLGVPALPAGGSEERLLIARLNLQAGKKAKMTGSTQQALSVIRSGMEVLGFKQRTARPDTAPVREHILSPTGASLRSLGGGGGSGSAGYSDTHPQRVSPILTARSVTGEVSVRTPQPPLDAGIEDEAAEAAQDAAERRLWEDAYALVFGLFMERADCEHLLGNAAAADCYLKAALERARDEDDTLLVLHRLIVQKTNVGDFAAALTHGRRCLMILDIPFPLVSPQPPAQQTPPSFAPALLAGVPFAPSTASALISASANAISTSAGYQVAQLTNVMT